MFRAGLLLIIRSYYSEYTATGIYQRMIFTSFFTYRVVAPDEASSKHVEVTQLPIPTHAQLHCH